MNRTWKLRVDFLAPDPDYGWRYREATETFEGATLGVCRKKFYRRLRELGVEVTPQDRRFLHSTFQGILKYGDLRFRRYPGLKREDWSVKVHVYREALCE